MSYRRFHKRCDGAIEGFGGAIEVATELGDFDGVIEGAAVSLKVSTAP